MSNIDIQEYKHCLNNIKSKIQSSQIKAAIAVNSALIEFYWDLGFIISNKQKESNWGNKLIEKLSIDLKSIFPEMKGFSRTNLYYVKQFYEYFSIINTKNKIIPQVEGQLKHTEVPSTLKKIPWGHIKILISKIKDNEFEFTEILPDNLKSSLPTIEELEILENLELGGK